MLKTLILRGWQITQCNVKRTSDFTLHFNAQYLPHNITRCSNLHLSSIYWKSKGPDNKSEESVKSVETTVKKRRENADSLIQDVVEELTPNMIKHNNRKQQKETSNDLKGRLQEINEQVDSRKKNRSRRLEPQTTAERQSSQLKHMTTEQLMKHLKEKKDVQKQSSNVDPKQVFYFVNLLNCTNKTRLNFFSKQETVPKDSSKKNQEKSLKMDAKDWWNYFEQKDRMERRAYTPKNHYQEMIEWSEEGKLPNLPIENEVGMEEEENVSFHKHIFLHELIEKGFPKQGPIRKFMEAVALGLSMNPYLTVQEKEDHINWFRDYFKEKLDLLKTLGAIEDPKQIEAAQSTNET